MKTRTLFATGLTMAAVLLAGFSNRANAQELSFGPKIGYTNSTLAGNDAPGETEGRSNFTGGFFFKANAGEIVSIQPEILYSKRGATTITDDDPDGIALNVDYLQIPLLIKAQVPVGETVFPFVYAGPYGAFELDNNFNSQEVIGPFVFSGEGKADVNDFDYGVVLGAGMDFQVGGLFLGFDARYDIGMTKILKIDDEEQDLKNRAFTIFASLGVNLGD
ncbi:MAG TPA: hypothetical protein DCG19_04840 [Cryomorphaceae bacterium]|nr:hypothetical protein [Owenweeksia sp.]MBF99280.1 hypothetical protein [Owenweeksia sp.]HAD96709.1 hypothetical protein [Cryomorphaceae bacterium]HBF21436.1 hypothetical protein [Cryomorphaceae bacterium]|tara:strand:- start:841 stop:1497 length:657 start_codon:yes stop_codon:yes gene_type:complete